MMNRLRGFVIPLNLFYSLLRPSAEILAPKSRPLHAKLEQIIEVIVENLKVHFAVRDNSQLIGKLKQRRGRAYQLGKSAM